MAPPLEQTYPPGDNALDEIVLAGTESRGSVSLTRVNWQANGSQSVASIVVEGQRGGNWFELVHADWPGGDLLDRHGAPLAASKIDFEFPREWNGSDYAPLVYDRLRARLVNTRAVRGQATLTAQ